MIILIGGVGHTGKTNLAQNLLEQLFFPYMSLDHLKMGLYRGGADCGFTPLDDDDVIADKMWPIVQGIIDTCQENQQNIIMEGCYLPPEKVALLNYAAILPVYLLLSRNYIETNYEQIWQHENVIEKRLTRGTVSSLKLIAEHEALKKRCEDNHLPYFEINGDYQTALKDIQGEIIAKVKSNDFGLS